MKDKIVEEIRKWCVLMSLKVDLEEMEFLADRIMEQLEPEGEDALYSAGEDDGNESCGDCENYAEYDGGILYCSVCGSKVKKLPRPTVSEGECDCTEPPDEDDTIIRICGCCSKPLRN